MKKYFVLCLSLALGFGYAQAQERGKHHADPERRQEMHQFIQQEMLPVLTTEQATLMAKLSKEDQAFIILKRNEIAAIKEEMKGKRGRDVSEEDRAAMKETMRAHHDKHKAVRESMLPFIERNQELLTAAVEGLEPQYSEWVAQQKTIIAKYKDTEAPGKGKGIKERPATGYGLFGMAGSHKGHQGKHPQGEKENVGEPGVNTRLAMQLLLWDGKLPGEGKPLQNRDGQFVPKGSFQLNSFPNPAETNTKLSFTLENPTQKVRLTVRDQAGQLVKEWTWENMAAGRQEVDLSVEALASGVYFYLLEADGQTDNKRFVVK